MLPSEYLPLLFSTAFIWIIFRFFQNYISPGVREIPGPIAAKLSNLYRLFDVSKGLNQVSLVALHEKYGDNVRFGPQVVSIRNPNDVNKVYGIKSHYIKSGFYAVQQQLANGKATQTIFTTLDEAFHAKIKRPVANAYSMTALTDYEHLVDRTIETLFQQLETRFANSKENCPLFEWLQFYAFDVIGEVTCSTPLGFLEQGRDVDGIIEALCTAMDYNAIVGQLPWLDYWLKKNPVWASVAAPTGPVAKFARERLVSRLQEAKQSSDQVSTKPQKGDFVDRFLRAKETHPEVVDDGQVFSYMITNMFAGSDTTAISLRAIVYYVVKNPRVYSKLMLELDSAKEAGELSVPTTWKQSQQLEYFDCIVKEALRLHPAVGLILERIVPADGLKLECGTMLPPGTIVGASPWVVHRDKSVYGEDVDAFRPERWLPSDGEDSTAYNQRLKLMTGSTMTFGKGHRTCIGRNISLLEIYKMLPSLFLTYSITLSDPKATWKLTNSWFVRQDGAEVRLRRRDVKEVVTI